MSSPPILTSAVAGTLWAIDGASNVVAATAPVGGIPEGVAVNSTTQTIYVTNEGDQTVSVISGADNL